MDRPTRYKLTVRLEIQKESWNGPITPDKKFDESVDGYWRTEMNERLSVNEDILLGSMDFLGIMGVLGDLHHAVKAIGEKK